MRQLVIILLTLLLGACGGTPARPSYRGQSDINSMRSGLSLDADYTRIDKDQYPDLYKAVLKSDFKKVRELLGVSPSTSWIASGGHTIVGIKTSWEGRSATLEDLLYYAMKKGDMDLAGRLLDDGADPNALNSQGLAALHVLYAKGKDIPRKEKFAGMLTGRGADPNLKTWNGDTLLNMALKSDIDNKTGAIKYLVSIGADPNLRSWDQKTALQAVFDSGMSEKREIIEYMLANGADPNITDRSGSTLLQAVFESDMEGKPGMIRYLMAHGADPDLRDQYGNTLIHKALSPRLRYKDGVSEKEIISWIDPMIEKGADLDIRNNAGMTPLSYAKGDVEAYLLLKGAKDYGAKPGEIEASGIADSEGLPADNILGMTSFDLLGLKREACQKLLRDYGVKFAELEEI